MSLLKNVLNKSLTADDHLQAALRLADYYNKKYEGKGYQGLGSDFRWTADDENGNPVELAIDENGKTWPVELLLATEGDSDTGNNRYEGLQGRSNRRHEEDAETMRNRTHRSDSRRNDQDVHERDFADQPPPYQQFPNVQQQQQALLQQQVMLQQQQALLQQQVMLQQQQQQQQMPPPYQTAPRQQYQQVQPAQQQVPSFHQSVPVQQQAAQTQALQQQARLTQQQVAQSQHVSRQQTAAVPAPAPAPAPQRQTQRQTQQQQQIFPPSANTSTVFDPLVTARMPLGARGQREHVAGQSKLNVAQFGRLDDPEANFRHMKALEEIRRKNSKKDGGGKDVKAGKK